MHRVAAMAMVAGLVLGASACGSDDGDDGAADDPTTTAAPDDTGSDDGSDITVDPGDLAFLPEDCQFLAAGAFLNPLAAVTPGGEADLEASADQLAALADSAPDEIADAMAVIADRFGQLAEALQGIDLSDPQAFADPAVAEAFSDLEPIFDDEFEAAGDAVSTYVEENCSGG
jgi:hypothetical protein